MWPSMEKFLLNFKNSFHNQKIIPRNLNKLKMTQSNKLKTSRVVRIHLQEVQAPILDKVKAAAIIQSMMETETKTIVQNYQPTPKSLTKLLRYKIS
jgi:hypothetical protein